MKILTHKFESEVIGKPPYRLIDVYQLPAPSLQEHNPEAYNRGWAGAPFGAGSCGYCGTGILKNFICRSSDGITFVLGCECVKKLGDAKLITEVKAYQNKILREKAAAKREERAVARTAAKAIELNLQREKNNGLTNYETAEQARKDAVALLVAPIQDLIDYLATSQNDFYEDLGRSLAAGGKVYGRGFPILIKVLSKAGFEGVEDRLETYFENIS